MDIIETVARALCTEAGHDPDSPTCDIWYPDDPDASKPWAGYRRDARAAIKATLEHVRDNVSDKAAFSGMLAIIGDKMDYGSDPDDAKACFRAMMVQTMKELE